MAEPDDMPEQQDRRPVIHPAVVRNVRYSRCPKCLGELDYRFQCMSCAYRALWIAVAIVDPNCPRGIAPPVRVLDGKSLDDMQADILDLAERYGYDVGHLKTPG